MPLLHEPVAPTPPPHPELDPRQVERLLAPLLSEARKRRIERVLRRRLFTVSIVLENLHDPHNGAAALRTCEALGLLHVHVVQTRDPFPISGKVSQRAHKWLNVHFHESIEACLGRLKAWGFQCWATVPPMLHPETRGVSVPADGPVALVYGNEHSGLSPRAVDLCDGLYAIPMYGFTESLNLSVSVAVSLREITERRRAHLARPGDLPRRAHQQLRAAYYAAATPFAADVLYKALEQ